LTDNRKFHISISSLFIIFSLFLLFDGYFKIGLVSDDYLNFYDATHSTIAEKFTGKLPFTNTYHLRPIYYLSIEKSLAISRWLGFAYDDFTLYRIQNLILLLLISYITGRLILQLSGRYTLAFIASLSVLLFPSNLNNICWTAARVDLLCALFYISIIFFTVRYIETKDILSSILIFLSYFLALFTKETSITIPIVVILLVYFIYGREILLRHKYLFLSLSVILFMILLYRVIIMGGSITTIATLYQKNPFSNAPGVIARSLIALTVPLDFLTLSRMLRQDNKIVLLYLASLYGAAFYLIWVMIKVDVYKHIGQLIILWLILILPYIYVGYIRPQMVFIPFIVLLIHILWVYDHHRQFNVSLNKNILRAFFAFTLIFWCAWSYILIEDWGISYTKAKDNINSLISTGLEHPKHNVIIGSPGRFKQTFLFDKLTGAYNYWKEKDFTIKDTINDIIQTGALDESSIGAKLDLADLGNNEFEIKATGKTQFFYIEGYNYEKIKSGFRNSDINVEFTEFNYLEKPIKMKLKIFSDNVSCYLASEFRFIKIF
jgi:hypothetical protein